MPDPASALGQQRDQGMALPAAVTDVALPPSRGDKKLVLWQTCCPFPHLSTPFVHHTSSLTAGGWGKCYWPLCLGGCFFFRGQDMTWSPLKPTGPFPCLQRISDQCQSSWYNQKARQGPYSTAVFLSAEQEDIHPSFPPHQRPCVVSGRVRAQMLVTDQPSGSGKCLPSPASASTSSAQQSFPSMAHNKLCRQKG